MIHPFTKLHRTLGIGLKPNRNNHFQRIMICIVTFSVRISYSKFSNNCIFLRFTILILEYFFNMIIDCIFPTSYNVAIIFCVSHIE